MPTKKNDPGAVDAYLAGLPDAEQTALEELRELIKSTVPEVQEGSNAGLSPFTAAYR